MPSKRKIVRVPPLEILQWLAHGFTLQEMATEFGVSVGGMRHRVRAIYRSFEMVRQNSAHAVQIAHNAGLLKPCRKQCILCKEVQQRNSEGS